MDKMTEHKRYYITVPKNVAAEYAYDHGEETKEQIERLILSGYDFYRIYRLGLFDDINIACDSLIDDYEEEILKGEQLTKAAEVLDKYLSEKNDRLILEIKQMVMLAAEYGTCIGFDF